MFLPAKTLPRVIAPFAASLHALQAGEVKARLASQGLELAISSSHELRKIIAADLTEQVNVLREAGNRGRTMAQAAAAGSTVLPV